MKFYKPNLIEYQYLVIHEPFIYEGLKDVFVIKIVFFRLFSLIDFKSKSLLSHLNSEHRMAMAALPMDFIFGFGVAWICEKI